MTGRFSKFNAAETFLSKTIFPAYALVVAMLWLVGCDKTRNGLTTNGSNNDNSAGNAIYAGYGGSASCRECHEEAYDNWAKSHHALAERMPNPLFDNAAFIPSRTFKHGSQRTSLRGTNGQYQVITAGLDGTNEVFQVARILGENPLRQMLIECPAGRVQVTEAAWDPRSNEWFNVYGSEDRKPGEWGHWLGRGMNWNSMCVACHNTRVLKNYDVAADAYKTTMVEHGVGCEACHGPMKAHNDWQHANKNSSKKDPTITKLNREQYFNVCAGCHSRRAELTAGPVPGDDYFDHHSLTIVDDSNVFYPDGQIWDEDYEVTAFMGSKMFHKGVRCMDCHDVHTMKTRLPGNMLCLTCHGPGATNAPAIDPVAHSHHKVFGYDTNGVLLNVDITKYAPANVKETGGECVNCHMPQTPYMQRHWRHDHGFTVPDPLLTKQFQIPNACNRCHQDKTVDWSLQYVDQWYGTNMDRSYRWRGQTIARARKGDATAVEPLLKMLRTDEQFYWRAVAANLLQRWCDESRVTVGLIAALKDTNALVRQSAAGALGPLAQAGQAEIIDALRPLLADRYRVVRVEAARQLAASLDTNSPAGSDLLNFLNQSADQPLGQLQIGMFEFQRGDLTNALSHFQAAAKWDPYSAGIRHELAIVLSQFGRMADAVNELQRAVALAPNEAEYHYKLALALNEVGDAKRVLSELEMAVQLDPHHARAAYNLGLARNAAGDSNGAVQALRLAETADLRDPRIPYAMATIQAQLGQKSQANESARRALAIDPAFRPAIELLQQLNR